MPLTERLSSRVAAEALALAGSEPRGVPAVIDTNVVLDLIYWEDPHSEDLRRALEEGRIHALRSGEAVMELAEVLSRPAFTGCLLYTSAPRRRQDGSHRPRAGG